MRPKSSAVTQRSRKAPEWSQGQDITSQPGFAWCCLAEEPAALAPVGSAASLGAVWLNGWGVQLGSCCSKHSQQGRWFGLVEESPCCAVEVLGDVVVPLAVTLGWELWLWE